ncbi:glycosyltransferase family 39 protein [Telluribacter sp.]|jgi:4-amino-4-deoxy-L-arabinose transferase-like glycosyltransferase|uniref:ArnT family glycosyltransferase n=1 Tax=Telluribacter sp. TaxID=1978767 RepID=UPI002E12F315|nr:glycosyltransferase family 39 protein [Telluribacter sp.]
MIFSGRYRYFFLFLVVAFGFFWNLGNAPLFDEDEGFFAEGTREMALRGDFISTYINQEPRFDKPPLTNWLQYGAAQVLGWNEWAMRLPSALAALAWMLAIFLLVRKRLSEKEAFYATFMATCSLQITIIGKAALADALLNASMAGAMFCLYEVLQGSHRKYTFLFYGLSALGFVSKGPIAVLIPAAVTMLYLLRWRSIRPLWKVLSGSGILLFLLISLPWYLLQYQQMGQAFIDGFFFNHNVNRFRTAFEGHYGSILYFVPILLLGIVPYTAVVLSAFGRLRYLWYDKYFSFHLLWFAFVFVFFSLSGTKLHHYIIYGYTPLFVLGAWYMANNHSVPLIWPLLVFLIILLVAPFMLPQFLPMINDAYAVDVTNGAAAEFDQEYYLSMGGLLLVLLVVEVRKGWGKDLQLVVVGLVLLITINGLWMPRLGALLQQPVKEAARLARERKYQPLVVLDHYYPSFHFYSGLFAEERTPRSGDVVLARKYRLNGIANKEILFEKHGLVLARITGP